jgi:hypothetical protein
MASEKLFAGEREKELLLAFMQSPGAIRLKEL